MKIKTPLHADHHLDQWAGQGEIWRQRRPHPRSRSPHDLWEHAVALTSGLSPWRVATHVRLGVTDRTKHLATHHELPAGASPLPLGVVEVPPATAWPQAAPAMQSALHRADGARLSIRSPQSTSPLAALVRAFVAGRSGATSARTAASLWLPRPSIAAQGSRAWPPCVGRCAGRPPLRALSPGAATAQGQPARFSSLTVRAPGWV